MKPSVRFAFAGDRDIAVWVLQYLVDGGFHPSALLLRAAKRASHDGELRALCEDLPDERVLRGKRFREPRGLELLRGLELDYIVGVHFPYIVPPEVLSIPRHGVLNLHPAYLPYNRGWHTPSWAILDGTPVGATLHFMDEGIDSGDVVAQRRVEPRPDDTADALYRRIKRAELALFKEAWPRLVAGTAPRTPQQPGTGTEHRKEELLSDERRRIDLDRPRTAAELLRRLRAHTTSDPSEALFFEQGGRRYRVRVEIEPET